MLINSLYDLFSLSVTFIQELIKHQSLSSILAQENTNPAH